LSQKLSCVLDERERDCNLDLRMCDTDTHLAELFCAFLEHVRHCLKVKKHAAWTCKACAEGPPVWRKELMHGRCGPAIDCADLRDSCKLLFTRARKSRSTAVDRKH